MIAKERLLHRSEKFEKICHTTGTSVYLGPLRGSTIEFDRGRIAPEERTLRERTARPILCVLIEGAREQILPVPLSPLSVYSHRRIDPRTIKCRWRATPSERCAALPAEGRYDRVCPLEG